MPTPASARGRLCMGMTRLASSASQSLGCLVSQIGFARRQRDSETPMRLLPPIPGTRLAGVAWSASAKTHEAGLAAQVYRDPLACTNGGPDCPV